MDLSEVEHVVYEQNLKNLMERTNEHIKEEKKLLTTFSFAKSQNLST
ncbi:MAG: hypothetical protein RXO71_03350 [Nitrososphaeria archaeon]